MRRRRIFEGKAKVLFEGPQPGTLVQYFKDDTSAFNNKKKGIITGKGVLNNRISEYLMVRLGEIGVPTHFVRRLNMREQLIREVEIIRIKVMVRNVAAGSIAKRLGLERLGLYHDPKGALFKAFGVTGLPTTFLIDRRGRIVGAYPGPAEWDEPEARALIEHYLRRPAGAAAVKTGG